MESKLRVQLSAADWKDVIKDNVTHFSSAKAALLSMDMSSQPDAPRDTIRKVTLRAEPRLGKKPSRFDCVACVDTADALQRPFRAQVCKFFRISAKLIVDQHDREILPKDDHIVFVLVGGFRRMVHQPFTSEHDFGPGQGVPCTRQNLLGTTLVKLPPNHVPMGLWNWHALRFAVILLRDVKSTLHITPLTRADGTPYRAQFDADGNMPHSLPSQQLVQFKQLHLLNESIYI